jgi:hypothetical protein
MRLGLALTLAFAAGGCAHASLERIAVLDATIPELLEQPGFYNNAVVRVRGASVARFEANYICASEAETVADGQAGRCLWLSPVAGNDGLAPIDPALYEGKVVEIVGVFDRDFHGHGGAYGGAIAPLRTRPIGAHAPGGRPPTQTDR